MKESESWQQTQNFLIPISFQPDGINSLYLKLIIFNLTVLYKIGLHRNMKIRDCDKKSISSL